MTKIKYSLFDTEIEAVMEAGVRDSRLVIELTGVKGGAIVLEGVSTPLTDGKAAFDLTKLANGVHHPILTVNSLTLRLPAFIKDGDGVRMPPLTDAQLRRLSLRARQSEERLAKLEADIIRLENYIKNTTIF